ncbi:hypothetical protein WMY93_034183, partial [Mugilogobius chulae]
MPRPKEQCTFNIECVFQMPRPKGWKRSLAARERRADQLAIGCRPYLSPPPPPDPKVTGTGRRHSATKQNWPVSVHTNRCHKLVIPPECPGKKFVFVIGHSHLRAIVDGFVRMPEGCLSFGFSSTPGGSANDLHRELMQIALPREPDLVLLLAPCNNLRLSPTITDAGTEFGLLLSYLVGRFQKVLVLDFPTRIAEDLEIQNLLRQEFRRVAASGVSKQCNVTGLSRAEQETRYFPVAEHFPVDRLELWSDGTHLSDDHGMGIYVQLMWQACYMELETPAPAPKVSHPPTRPSTRRVQPMLVVTGPLPRTPPPPSEWTPAEQGRKKNQRGTPRARLGDQDIAGSTGGATDTASKSCCPQNQPRDAVEATAVVVRPAVSSASLTPGPEEHKPVEVRPRRSLTRSSPGLEVRPCSPASTPPAQEEDQAVVEVRSLSPQRPSYADVVKGLSPVPSTSGMAVKRSSPASSSTSGMEEEVSRETIKPAAPKRRRFRDRFLVPVLKKSVATAMQAGVVEVIPGTSPTSVTILDVFLEQDQLDQHRSFTQIPDNIRGPFHQGDDLFEFKGVQCMAIALVALAKHTVCTLDFVRPGKVDEDNERLMVGHLPKSETIEERQFHFRYGMVVLVVMLMCPEPALIRLDKTFLSFRGRCCELPRRQGKLFKVNRENNRQSPQP